MYFETIAKIQNTFLKLPNIFCDMSPYGFRTGHQEHAITKYPILKHNVSNKALYFGRTLNTLA